MATSDNFAIMMEAKAAMERSQRLIEQMQALRQEVSQSLVEVTRSAAVLKVRASCAVTAVAQSDRRSASVVAVGIEPPALHRSTPAPHERNGDEQKLLDLLTPREIEVLRLIGEGQRTKEIAFTLGITFKTAVTHRSNIMEKLGIHEGPRLVRFAIRTGLVAA
jgi:DNA-binding NarL/FixJ family response regulator